MIKKLLDEVLWSAVSLTGRLSILAGYIFIPESTLFLHVEVLEDADLHRDCQRELQQCV
jgi:hypothetical protein